jgi:hypothetical protein
LAPSRGRTNGSIEGRIVDDVIDLIADAILSDLLERERGDGQFPLRPEP